MTNLVIEHRHALGDTAVLTALLRDLALAWPGRYRVWANVHFPDLLRHNPHVHRAGTWSGRSWPPGFRVVRAEYGRGIQAQRDEVVHFLAWFHRDFEAKTGVHVPVTRPAPDLHLSAVERVRPWGRRYWLFVAGGKSDAAVKIWPRAHWQSLARLARAVGIEVVQVGSRQAGHIHYDLDGVLNLVGHLNVRDLVRWVAHAEGVVCGITGVMHLAAALARPCVVLAGGREAPHWEAYVRENPGLGGPHVARRLAAPHRFLHLTGALDCARPGGCWRNDVVPQGLAGLVCYYPDALEGQTAPRCMTQITPRSAFEAMLSYHADGTLPIIPAVGKETRFALPDGRAGTVRVELAGGMITSNQPAPPPETPAALLDGHEFDHPAVGGKFTVFVLLYGDYPVMHRECLDALLRTTPPHRVALRLLLCQPCEATERYAKHLLASGRAARVLTWRHNPGKYRVMRHAFRDSGPLATEYLVWLDDDTICDRDPLWLRRLAGAIAQEHPKGARLFGPAHRIDLQAGQDGWIRAAPWYRGRPFRDRFGRETPRGRTIHFAVGAFWALHIPTMVECDVPDARLEHNGGDVMIGEQVHQAGWKLAGFGGGGTAVRFNSRPRRGRSDPPAGTQ